MIDEREIDIVRYALEDRARFDNPRSYLMINRIVDFQDLQRNIEQRNPLIHGALLDATKKGRKMVALLFLDSHYSKKIGADLESAYLGGGLGEWLDALELELEVCSRSRMSLDPHPTFAEFSRFIFGADNRHLRQIVGTCYWFGIEDTISGEIIETSKGQFFNYAVGALDL
jgi:hypothetical protein